MANNRINELHWIEGWLGRGVNVIKLSIEICGKRKYYVCDIQSKRREGLTQVTEGDERLAVPETRYFKTPFIRCRSIGTLYMKFGRSEFVLHP
jgi:hypothetical protein